MMLARSSQDCSLLDIGTRRQQYQWVAGSSFRIPCELTRAKQPLNPGCGAGWDEGHRRRVPRRLRWGSQAFGSSRCVSGEEPPIPKSLGRRQLTIGEEQGLHCDNELANCSLPWRRDFQHSGDCLSATNIRSDHFTRTRYLQALFSSRQFAPFSAHVSRGGPS